MAGITLSCSTSCVPDLNRAEALKTISEAGYRYVEAYSGKTESRLSPDVVFAEQVLADLAHYGLTLSALNISDISVGCNLTGIKREIDYAASLGVSSVNIRGGHRTERDMNALVNCLRVLAPFAQVRGITINLRNCHGHRVETLDDYQAVFSSIDLPALGVVIDIGQFCSSKIDPLDAFGRFADRAHIVYTPAQIGRGAAAGTDTWALIAGLVAKGFEGMIVVEPDERTRNYARHIRQARVQLESILHGGGAADF
ncbi:MAG TPA: sugar phosphate isomerase/epimerase [Planctomycetota bacterium]|nr:sugar phosphate isomerase/epimerase [Planctomycetota bacterium]